MIRLPAVVVAALLVLASCPAIASQTDDPTRAAILTSLGLDRVPADYVVLLDTSGSMAAENHYSTAVSSLGGLFEALPAEDHVALYTFDTGPNLDYEGPSRPAPELLAKLPSVPNPGGKTDLGKAMAVALQELQRTGAASVANVVVITDGADDPDRGSPYANSAGPAWNTLRQQAKQWESSMLSVYAVPLGNGSAGAAVVRSVFDSTIVLTPGEVQNLREYLGRSKARVELAKARTVLASDTGKSLTTKWRIDPEGNGGARVVVTLTSTAQHVPLNVSDVRLDAGPVSLTVPARTYRIEPGKSVDITASLDTQPENDVLLKRTVTENVAVRLQATVQSSWTKPLLPEIKLDVDRKLTSQSLPVTLTHTAGSSLFLPVVALLVLGLIMALLFLLRRRGGVLGGTLVVSTGVQPAELAKFVLTGRKMMLDGLPGRGWITPDNSWNKRGDLKITYTNAPGVRPPVTGRCASGGSLILGGLSFSHLQNGD